MVPLVGKFALLIPHFIRDRYENKDIFSRHLRYRSDSGPTPPWGHSHQQTHKKINPQNGVLFFYGAAGGNRTHDPILTKDVRYHYATAAKGSPL